MTTILKEYKQRLQHEHGWDVELTCSACGHDGLPDYDGWTPSMAVNFGDTPTIYANLSCRNCGKDLNDEAGEKLVEVFSEVDTPARNRRILAVFIGLMVGIPLLMIVGIVAGVLLGWWGPRAFIALTALSVLVLPAIFWFNWQIHSIRHRCECGRPSYVFMGLLGRSYCYRCSTCGRLLRLRD